jgi:peptidoglycan/LPS O-acetylase OafA/YrhL
LEAVASEWLKNQMISPEDIHPFNHLIQIITLTDFRLNVPLWTIRVELICSMLLPWIILWSKNSGIRTVVIIIAFAAVLETHQAGGALGEVGWFFAFYIGYQINYLNSSFKYLNAQTTRWLMLGLVLAFVGCLKPGLDTITAVILAAAILALLVPCHWIALKKILNAEPLQFLGKISFSFYVSHTPVLLICWYLLARYYPGLLKGNHGAISAMILSVVSIIPTLVIATFSEKYIERTFNVLGHKLTGKIN